MKRYVKEIGVAALVFTVGLSVVALSSYRSNLDKKASNELAAASISTATQLLGVSDISNSGKFFVKGIVLEQNKDETTATLVVKNDTANKYEFSPGLQIFAVLTDGSEVGISGLSDPNPLTGGPMEPGQIVLGSVKYATQKNHIKYIRLYTSPEKTTHTDTEVK
jgi:hypothetical protein